MPRQILLEVVTTDHCEIDTDFALGIQSPMAFHAPLRREGSRWDKLPKELKTLLQAVFAIDGINLVNLRVHQLIIGKGRLFKWEDIYPRIQEAISAAFDDFEFVETPEDKAKA